MMIVVTPVHGQPDLYRIPFQKAGKFLQGRIRWVRIGEAFQDQTLPSSVVEALRGRVVRVVLTAEHLFEQTGNSFRREVPDGSCLGYAIDFAQRLTDIGHFQPGKTLRKHCSELDMIVLPAGQFEYVEEPKK